MLTPLLIPTNIRTQSTKHHSSNCLARAVRCASHDDGNDTTLNVLTGTEPFLGYCVYAMGLPSLLLSAFLWLVLKIIFRIRVKRLTLRVWGEWRLVLDGLELPRWLLHLLVPRAFQSLEVESLKVQSIQVVVQWPRFAFASSSSSSSSSSNIVVEVKGLHISLLASSISSDETRQKEIRASSVPVQRTRGFQPPKTNPQQTGKALIA